jgi:hypothetical protein
MATMTIELDEKDLAEAVDMFLAARGLRAKGKPTVRHFAGDQREASCTTIVVETEARTAARAPRQHDMEG